MQINAVLKRQSAMVLKWVSSVMAMPYRLKTDGSTKYPLIVEMNDFLTKVISADKMPALIEVDLQ